jgi:hypothetical protein
MPTALFFQNQTIWALGVAPLRDKQIRLITLGLWRKGVFRLARRPRREAAWLEGVSGLPVIKASGVPSRINDNARTQHQRRETVRPLGLKENQLCSNKGGNRATARRVGDEKGSTLIRSRPSVTLLER